MLVLVSDMYSDIWCLSWCHIFISIFGVGGSVGFVFRYLVSGSVSHMDIDI